MIVLVVSTSDTVELRLRLMLEAEGIDVRFAPAADGVLPQLPDLVVVDDGLSASLRQQLHRLAVAVPVVVVDASGDWDAMRRRISALLRPATEAEALTAALARARVLVVDDSATYREYLRLEIERWGAWVRTANGAADAVAALAAEAFDAVILDLVLPGGNGTQLCARVAQQRREQRLSMVLVVMSSRESPADLARSLEAGADEFLGKSLAPALLRTRFGALLRYRLLRMS